MAKFIATPLTRALIRTLPIGDTFVVTQNGNTFTRMQVDNLKGFNKQHLVALILIPKKI